MPSSNSNIGYIGLGVMGGALAQRLLLSTPLTVFDLSASAVSELVNQGATAATSLTALAKSCEVIFLCLPRSENVEQVLFGQDGLAQALKPGSVIVDQTSGDPALTRILAARLSEQGVAMVDAPVSGGAIGAQQGTIAIMTGGEDAVMARVRPILAMISPNIFHCGDIGAGQVMKLINNTISTCNRFAMLEGIALGRRNGLDLQTMSDVLNSGGARSKVSESILPALIEGEANSFFLMSLMLKDVNLASRLADEMALPNRFGQLAREMLEAASEARGEGANLFEIADYVAEQANTSFKRAT